MAIALDANRLLRTPGVCLQSGVQCCGNTLISLALTLIQPGSSQDSSAGFAHHGIQIEYDPLLESSALPYRMYRPDQLTQGKQMSGVFQFRRLAWQLRKERQSKTFHLMQTSALPVTPGSRHSNVCSDQLGQEIMLLLNLRITPAFGAVELGYPASSVIVMQQIHPVFVTVQRIGFTRQPEAKPRDGGYHSAGRECGKRMCHGAPRRRVDPNGNSPSQTAAYPRARGVRAMAQACTSCAPASRHARASASSVAPVVMTSSNSATRSGSVAEITNASRRLRKRSLRSRPRCEGVWQRRCAR